MFNQVRLELRASWRAFTLLLAPGLLALLIALFYSEGALWLFAIAITLANIHFAYQAAILNPSRSVININRMQMSLVNKEEHHSLLFDEQLWFSAYWGLIRFKTSDNASYLIFISPLTVRNTNEVRRMKVHAIHNKQLSLR